MREIFYVIIINDIHILAEHSIRWLYPLKRCEIRPIGYLGYDTKLDLSSSVEDLFIPITLMSTKCGSTS